MALDSPGTSRVKRSGSSKSTVPTASAADDNPEPLRGTDQGTVSGAIRDTLALLPDAAVCDERFCTCVDTLRQAEADGQAHDPVGSGGGTS